MEVEGDDGDVGVEDDAGRFRSDRSRTGTQNPGQERILQRTDPGRDR